MQQITQTSMGSARALVQTLELVEWFALCVLPRGRLRRRLLGLVDRGFATMHRKNCDGGL